MPLSVYEKKVLKLAANIIKRELQNKTYNKQCYGRFATKLMIKQLNEETRISIPGFGCFYITECVARNGYPNSDETGEVFSYRQLRFRPYSWVRSDSFKQKMFHRHQ